MDIYRSNVLLIQFYRTIFESHRFSPSNLLWGHPRIPQQSHRRWAFASHESRGLDIEIYGCCLDLFPLPSFFFFRIKNKLWHRISSLSRELGSMFGPQRGQMCRHPPAAPGGATRASCPKKVPLFLLPSFPFVLRQKISSLCRPASLAGISISPGRSVESFRGPSDQTSTFWWSEVCTELSVPHWSWIESFGRFEGSGAGKSVANWVIAYAFSENVTDSLMVLS